jgi:hypothetical protein
VLRAPFAIQIVRAHPNGDVIRHTVAFLPDRPGIHAKRSERLRESYRWQTLVK